MIHKHRCSKITLKRRSSPMYWHKPRGRTDKLVNTDYFSRLRYVLDLTTILVSLVALRMFSSFPVGISWTHWRVDIWQLPRNNAA